jgi:hypothetical protein
MAVWALSLAYKKSADFDEDRAKVRKTCGLYYKPMTIVNDNSRVITKRETSLTDDARVIIYNHHMFIVQVTGA